MNTPGAVLADEEGCLAPIHPVMLPLALWQAVQLLGSQFRTPNCSLGALASPCDNLQVRVQLLLEKDCCPAQATITHSPFHFVTEELCLLIMEEVPFVLIPEHFKDARFLMIKGWS